MISFGVGKVEDWMIYSVAAEEARDGFADAGAVVGNLKQRRSALVPRRVPRHQPATCQ
jgi:hypothetical protein